MIGHRRRVLKLISGAEGRRIACFFMMQTWLLVCVFCMVLSIGDGQSLTFSDIIRSAKDAELSKHSEDVNFHFQERSAKDNQIRNGREDEDYITREEFDQGVQEIKDSMAELNNTLTSCKIEDGKTVAVRAIYPGNFFSTTQDHQFYFYEEMLDLGDCFDPLTSKFTCPQKGIYMFNVHVDPAMVVIFKKSMSDVLGMGVSFATLITKCEKDEVIFAGDPETGTFSTDAYPVFEGFLLEKLE